MRHISKILLLIIFSANVVSSATLPALPQIATGTNSDHKEHDSDKQNTTSNLDNATHQDSVAYAQSKGENNEQTNITSDNSKQLLQSNQKTSTLKQNTSQQNITDTQYQKPQSHIAQDVNRENSASMRNKYSKTYKTKNAKYIKSSTSLTQEQQESKSDNATKNDIILLSIHDESMEDPLEPDDYDVSASQYVQRFWRYYNYNNPNQSGKKISIEHFIKSHKLYRNTSMSHEESMQQLIDSVIHDAVDATRVILDNYDLLNSTDQSGNNMLHIAAIYGSNNVAKLLLARSIKVNATNNNNESAMFIAMLTGNKELVNMIRDALNSRDMHQKK